MPLITRADLRLALTTGLVNGFSSISGLAYGYYAPLAVLAACSGTYGSSLELGRQRILGSLLGGVLLEVGLHGLQGLPMPVGLAIALGSLRLIGGALGLKVGYKVGGIVMVMGWLVHHEELGDWLPLRLFWTVVGLLITLLSLRLFWPSRSQRTVLATLADLFSGLAEDLELEATALAPAGAPAAAPTGSAPEEAVARLRARQATLQKLRAQRPALDLELGTQPLRHPLHRLVETLEWAASRLLSASRELAEQPLLEQGSGSLLTILQADQAELLRVLAERLSLWSRLLGRERGLLPPPPATPLRLPPDWLALEEVFSDPRLDQLPPPVLERLAAGYTLGRMLHEAIETAERGWRTFSLGSEARRRQPPALQGRMA
ncbi:FUSC family protein [Cyanobium sp. FGCU-52]|nr:FUSC family protein [Cyanobium sp. FGCU52]